MRKDIHFFGYSVDSALDRFDMILQLFIQEYEGDSRYVDEVSLARSLVGFIKSDNTDYYNA